MKRILFLLACFISLGFLQGPLMACHLSSFTLVSQSYNSFTQQYTIQTQLNVGSGITGVTKGGDQGTTNILFGLWKACGPLVLHSFSPNTITGPMGCLSAGVLGLPNTHPYGADAFFGYVMMQNCGGNGFTCVTSTPSCGPATTNTYLITFYTNLLPDSIRAFGVEGGGNYIGGCYPDADMKITFPSSWVVNCPPTQTVVAGPSCTATLPDYSTLATAPPLPCPVTITSVTQSPVLGTLLSGAGPVTVALTGNGGTYGNSTCNFVVNVVDQTPPTVTCPANATVSLDAACEATLADYTIVGVATDNCTASPTITQSPSAGLLLTGIGATTVTLTAADGSANTGTCTFTMTTADQAPPTVTCPANATVALDAACQALLADYTLTASAADNCTASPAITQSPSAGSLLSGVGTTTVTLTATDGGGNTAACTLIVTQVDQTPPVATCPASFTHAPVGLDCNPPVTWAAVTATDNCGATLAGSHASGDAFPVGATTVTYTATDGSGNTSSCSFTITVTPPQIVGTTTASSSNPCEGDTVTLTALAATSYAWSTGGTGQTVQVDTTGWVWVDVTNSLGCTARDSILMTFAPLPQPAINQVGPNVCTGSFASYQWFYNGSAIPGGTSACTAYLGAGNYSVDVTDFTGCSATGGPVSMFAASVDDPLSNVFAIYPNPAQDQLYLQLTRPVRVAGRIVLYDISGKVVRSFAFGRLDLLTELSLDGLADGSYLLEVQARGFSGMKKVVKLR